MAGIIKDGQLYCIGGGSDNYSTEEQIIGTWIDGKPIYRKVISCGALPNTTTKTVSHGISNIDMIVDLKGVSKNESTKVYIPMNYAPDSVKISSCFVKGDDIYITCLADRSEYTESYIILEYTKTTD